MRVLISSVGTRGDVQPAIALALAIRSLGHQVRLCVSPNFVEWAENLGFEARPLGIAMRGAPPATVPDLITDQFETLASAAEDYDLIVGAGVHQYAARSVAQFRGIPCVIAAYAPVSLPSAGRAPLGHVDVSAEPEKREAMWTDFRRGWNAHSLERVNANRVRLGLTPVTDALDHILGARPWLAADPVLAPTRPASGIVQTGAWILEDDRPLPADVEAFLNAGEPPIYVGFGSMPTAAADVGLVLAAARAAGRRLVVSRGWGEFDLPDAGPDCIMVDDVSHQRLFPRVAAVVHHGGAGTTTNAARAGVSQIITPMFSDQFYWARRVADLGLGRSGQVQAMGVEGLTILLQDVLGAEIANQARALSNKVRGNGTEIAASRLMAEQT